MKVQDKNITFRVPAALHERLVEHSGSRGIGRFIRSVLERAFEGVSFRDEDAVIFDRLFPNWRKQVEIAKLEARLAELKGEDE